MAPSRAALALAAVAAAAQLATGLNSLPAAGVPCSTVAPGSPASSPTYCDNLFQPIDYYAQMKAGTLSLTDLGAETNGGCSFIEDTFEETFSSPVLNFTRWLPEELDGQEHCIGLPPAGNTTCTMMMSQQVKLAQTMPSRLGGGTGAILTLSQSPCAANPAACCNRKGNMCAKWAGAHLVSAGCIQYGVLELEAAFDMPANAGGFYFTATYVVYGDVDPAWNEIDIGMINNVLGQLEFHATVFTADRDTPTGTLMDALNFAQSPIGTSINVNTTIKKINNINAPQVYYNTSFASTFHTYKVVWTRTTVAWMVDRVVYRNITYAPWRPMSIRQILRTNKGVNAVGPQFGDSSVYIRRIRYTPLSDKAVADAYRCNSMYECYGQLPAPPMGTATTYVSLASGDISTPPAGRHHRHRALLQSVASNGAVLEYAVASLLPGMPAGNVSAVPTAYSLSLKLTVFNVNPLGPNAPLDALGIFTADSLQTPFVSGLADDVKPAPSNVLVQSVEQDASGTDLFISVLISGYVSAEEVGTDFNVFAASGAAELDNTAAALNDALGLASTPYITQTESVSSSLDENFPGPATAAHAPTPSAILQDSTKCQSYPQMYDATCVDSTGAHASVWCADCVLLRVDDVAFVTTYAVSAPVAASAVDQIEGSLSSALSSGAMGAAIADATATRRRSRSLLQTGGGDGSLNLTATSNLAIQRLVGGVAAAELAACQAAEEQSERWRAVGIAFVIFSGVLLVLVIIAFKAGRRAGEADAEARMTTVSSGASPMAASKRLDALHAEADSPYA